MSESPPVESSPPGIRHHGPVFNLGLKIEAWLVRHALPTLADSTRPWPELDPSSPLQPPPAAYAMLGYDALRYYLRFVCRLQEAETIRPPNPLEMLISPALRQGYLEFCRDFGRPQPVRNRVILSLEAIVDRLLGWDLDRELRAAYQARLGRAVRRWGRRRTLKLHFLPEPGPEPELDPNSPVQPRPETLANLCRAARVVYLGYVKELQDRRGELWWESPRPCVSRLIPGFWAGYAAFYRDFWLHGDEEAERLGRELAQFWGLKSAGDGRPGPAGEEHPGSSRVEPQPRP